MQPLAGLDTIAWKTLVTTGYMPATSIPVFFNRLLEPKAAVSARAAQDLFHSLVPHDGYPSPYLDVGLAAAPFVGRLALDPESPVRAPMLRLLAELVSGRHVRRLSWAPDLSRLDAEALASRQAMLETVIPFAQQALPLLRDEDPAVRASTAFLLAWLPDLADQSLPALAEVLQAEKRPPVCATQALALGYLARWTQRTEYAPLLRTLTGMKAPIGWCANLAAILADPARMDDLEDAVFSPSQPPKPVVRDIPFNHGAILQLGGLILEWATAARNHLGRHLAMLAKARGSSGPWLPRVAFWSAYPATGQGGRLPTERFNPAKLAPLERRVLMELTLTLLRPHERGGIAGLELLDQIWPEAIFAPVDLADAGANAAHLYGILGDCGLFSSWGNNPRALGLTPPGPLEQVVDGAPLWHWLERTCAGELPFPEWLARLKDLDPLQVKAVCDAAAAHPYELNRSFSSEGGYDAGPLNAVLERTLLERAQA